MIVAAIVLGVVGVVLAAVLLPPRLVDRSLRGAAIEPVERLSAENEMRRVVFEAAVVLLALVALYFTFSEMLFTREQLLVNQQELLLNRDVQQRERFAAAVEQLGSAGPTVQTAGIYAMEAIAISDPGYRIILEETLAAFLRTTAVCDPPQGKPCAPRSPGADPAVQTAVTVIGAADPAARGGRRLDLRRVNLSYIDLRGGNFAAVDFVDSNLSFCDISGADLRGADMSQTRQEAIRGRADSITDAETVWP